MPTKDLTRSVKEFAVPVKTLLNVNHSIEEALDTLRKQKIEEKIVYFYVVDDTGKLEGVVPARRLLLDDQKQKIKEVMIDKVAVLKEDQSLQEAMELFTKHQLLALPVVDTNHGFMGILNVQLYLDDSFDVGSTHRRNDLFQILGLTLEEGKPQSPWKSFKTRMPWILCNMAGGIGCAIISRFYEPVLAKVILLAMFIPLILTLSESISMQSMTQSLQLVRQSGKSWKTVLSRVFKEGRLVTIIALTCGTMVGLISLLWGGGIYPSMTIAVSIAVSVSLSSSIGASIPLILYARSMDPKVASGPVVLMFADIVTTALYLTLATWWLL